MICTFFGHRYCPYDIEEKLRSAIVDRIQKGVTRFYVGNQGQFDRMVLSILRDLSKAYAIEYTVVLAYMPGKSGFPMTKVQQIPCFLKALKKCRRNLRFFGGTNGC